MTDTPQLIAWSGALTDAGQGLAAWLSATGQPVPDLPRHKLDGLPAVNRFFRDRPDEAAALWRAYSAEQEVVIHE